jgi:hypothetical protein
MHTWVTIDDNLKYIYVVGYWYSPHQLPNWVNFLYTWGGKWGFAILIKSPINGQVVLKASIISMSSIVMQGCGY